MRSAPAKSLARSIALILSTLAVCLFTGCTAAPVSAPDADPAIRLGGQWNPNADLEFSMWSPVAEGRLSASKGGVHGNTLSHRNDLNYHGREDLQRFRGKIFLTNQWTLDLNYIQFDESADDKLNKTIFFSGEGFHEGSTLDTDIDASTLSIRMERRLFYDRGEYFGLNFGILRSEGEATLKGTRAAPSTRVDRAKDDWEVYAPEIGIYYAWMTKYNWRWAMDMNTAWLRWSGDKLVYLDAGTTVSYFFWDHAAVFAGYRFSWNTVEDDRVDYKTRYFGPEIGVSIRF